MNRAEIFFWNLIVYLLLILLGEGVYWIWNATGLMVYLVIIGWIICWPHKNTEEQSNDNPESNSH